MGKGGSSTNVEIPDYIENAARNNLARADFVSKLGYVPQSYGPTVAAFTPMQESAFGNTAQTASAFGLGAPTGADVFGGMGEPTTYANGVRGYSAQPLFKGMMDEFAADRPGQFAAINSMFIDPYGYNPAGAFDMGSLVDINSTPIDDTTTTTTTTTSGGGGGGGGSSSIIDTGVGNVGGTGFTTYGGSQDVANQAVVDAFADYGARISAGEKVPPEENPAFNAGIKAANENVVTTFKTKSGDTVSKTRGSLTSSDISSASAEDQNRLAAESMLAAGIRNVGGGFAQDDPTTGLLGSLTDTKNFVTSEVAAAAAAAKEAARKAAADRRRKRDAKAGKGAFAKRPQKTGVGGRNIGGR
tara:strand:+ start:3967 stop:5037 length:1071 start_codon:yes stop_codon:yes gene_type:complete